MEADSKKVAAEQEAGSMEQTAVAGDKQEFIIITKLIKSKTTIIFIKLVEPNQKGKKYLALPELKIIKKAAEFITVIKINDFIEKKNKPKTDSKGLNSLWKATRKISLKTSKKTTRFKARLKTLATGIEAKKTKKLKNLTFG